MNVDSLNFDLWISNSGAAEYEGLSSAFRGACQVSSECSLYSWSLADYVVAGYRKSQILEIEDQRRLKTLRFDTGCP